MNFLRSRRGVAAVAVLLLILFLFRPGVIQLRNRISYSIGNALGRRVTIGNVRLRALPRPGFDLEGLLVYDDPAFSAEPMIRAQDVFAAIRFRSLLRGHLEIARLSASEPSINIVRASDGRWNLASLIERNAQIPAAPTQKAGSERRPSFPYLEATSARINFKFGSEKKSYALVDADVALWQDSENSWGARMKAEPVRTDFNLSDTGQLLMSAAWQRAAALRQTPLHMTVAWQRGQLGQITKLLTGKDHGWRGGLDFTTTFLGTPESLSIDNQTTIQGFRRYDILDNRNIRLATHCSGRYSATTAALADLLCESAVGNGTLRIAGNANVAAHPANYDLTIRASKIPVASLVELVHEAKQQLPRDLTAEGWLEGEFHAVRIPSGPARFTGSGQASQVLLHSSGDSNLIELGDVPLTLVSEGCCKDSTAHSTTRIRAVGKQIDPEPGEPHLRIGPASLVVNSSVPASVGGWISVSGYRLFLHGDFALKNLFTLETMCGLPGLQPAAEGSAKLDVSISGAWQGLTAPNALGAAQLKDVRFETRSLNTPIEISSATLNLAQDAVSLEKISASTGETRWTGSVQAPRHCVPACRYQFDLAADQLSTADLIEWFTPHPASRPWYRILSSGDQSSTEKPGGSPLLALEAQGQLRVGQFEIKKALATQLTTAFTVDHGKIALDHVRGQFLQGAYRGNWTINASSKPLELHASGALKNFSLERLSALMSDPWITGNADGTFDLTTSGASFREMLSNADGKIQISMRNGTFAHLEIPGAPAPLPVYRFNGNLLLKEGQWQLSSGRLESRDGLYEVNGKASPGKGVDFHFTRGDEQSWNITGSLAKPHATPASHREISRTEPTAAPTAKP